MPLDAESCDWEGGSGCDDPQVRRPASVSIAFRRRAVGTGLAEIRPATALWKRGAGAVIRRPICTSPAS